MCSFEVSEEHRNKIQWNYDENMCVLEFGNYLICCKKGIWLDLQIKIMEDKKIKYTNESLKRKYVLNTNTRLHTSTVKLQLYYFCFVSMNLLWYYSILWTYELCHSYQRFINKKNLSIQDLKVFVVLIFFIHSLQNITRIIISEFNEFGLFEPI